MWLKSRIAVVFRRTKSSVDLVADPHILKMEWGGGRQFISSVLIYRKCAQRNICLLHGKSGFFWQKCEPILVFWIRHWDRRVLAAILSADNQLHENSHTVYLDEVDNDLRLFGETSFHRFRVKYLGQLHARKQRILVEYSPMPRAQISCRNKSASLNWRTTSKKSLLYA